MRDTRAGGGKRVRRAIEPGLLALALALALALSGSATAADGPAYLVKNIRTGPDPLANSNPNGFVSVGDRVFFRARVDAGAGEIGDLWVTDRTAAGTRLVAKSTLPFTVLGDRVYYRAANGAGQTDLWVSDGTVQGTVLVAPNVPRVEGVFADRLYFLVGDTLTDLWVVDAAGARMITDGVSKVLGAVAGRVFFLAYGGLLVQDRDGVRSIAPVISETYAVTNDALFFATPFNEKIWRTDGTAAGTTAIAAGFPQEIIPTGDGIFYAIEGELWFSEGAIETARRVLPDGLWFTRRRFEPTALDGVLLFAATPSNGRDIELWRSDGTPAGSARIAKMALSTNTFIPDAGPQITINSVVYFTCDDGETGLELWRSDGTSNGTARVKDINAGAASAILSEFFDLFTSFHLVGSTLYFVASDGVTGEELWKTDGTEAGTALVKDLIPGGDGVYACRHESCAPPAGYPCADSSEACPNAAGISARVSDSQLVFSAPDPHLRGQRLAVTDGTAAGTLSIADGVATWTIAGRQLYYATFTDDGRQTDVWRRDLDSGQTAPVRRFAGGVSRIEADGEHAFLAASDGTFGIEPWWTDGTPTNAVLLRDIAVGEAGSLPRSLTDWNGTLVFRADDGIHGEELWRSDGSDAGTQLVRDIRPGDRSSSLTNFEPAGSLLFFSADDGVHGAELWRTDGSENGTALVADLRAGLEGSTPALLTAVGDTLYFYADNGVNGDALWRSEGSEADTSIVTSSAPRLTSETSGIVPAIDLDGVLLFLASDGGTGTVLWRSDGSSDGTTILAGVGFGALEGMKPAFARAGDAVVFNRPNGLWRSDGTREGTYRLSYTGGDLVTVGRHAYFSVHGYFNVGLWRTDGTELVRVTEAEPYGLVSAGQALFGLDDHQLWRLGFGTLPTEEMDHVLDIDSLDSAADRLLLTDAYGLWSSDGSLLGTTLLQEDVRPYRSSAYSTESDVFSASGETIYFSGVAGTFGVELWAIPVSALPDICTENCPAPIATPTRPPRTPVPPCDADRAVSFEMGSASGTQGDEVTVDVKFHGGGCAVSAVGFAASFDSDTFVKIVDGEPDCWFNPEVRRTISDTRFFPPFCVPGISCEGVHSILLGEGPILDGTVLHTCRVHIGSDATLGHHPILLSKLDISDTRGDQNYDLSGINGAIEVLAAPEGCTRNCPATPTLAPPPSTPTPSFTCAAGDSCALLQMGSATGLPGDEVTIDITLRQRNVEVYGATTSLSLEAAVPLADVHGRPDCSPNPEIHAPFSYFRFEPRLCTPEYCSGVHSESLGRVPIPDAAMLYTCRVMIAPDAAPGVYPLNLSLASIAVSPDGTYVEAASVDGQLTVIEPESDRAETGFATSSGGCNIDCAPAARNAALLLLPALFMCARRRKPVRLGGGAAFRSCACLQSEPLPANSGPLTPPSSTPPQTAV